MFILGRLWLTIVGLLELGLRGEVGHDGGLRRNGVSRTYGICNE